MGFKCFRKCLINKGDYMDKINKCLKEWNSTVESLGQVNNHS